MTQYSGRRILMHYNEPVPGGSASLTVYDIDGRVELDVQFHGNVSRAVKRMIRETVLNAPGVREYIPVRRRR